MDEGYHCPDVREWFDKRGYTARSAARGEERDALPRVAGYRARRRVVERTPSWFNPSRRLLIRREKQVGNYMAMPRPAWACIALRTTEVMG